jgi:hypothetical protein
MKATGARIRLREIEKYAVRTAKKHKNKLNCDTNEGEHLRNLDN